MVFNGMDSRLLAVWSSLRRKEAWPSKMMDQLVDDDVVRLSS